MASIGDDSGFRRCGTPHVVLSQCPVGSVASVASSGDDFGLRRWFSSRSSAFTCPVDSARASIGDDSGRSTSGVGPCPAAGQLVGTALASENF